MAITFPSNPSDGQVFNVDNRSWTYDATKDVWLGGQVVAAANAKVSEANALTYANNALTYANNAQQSAIDALNVIAAQFKGGVAGGAVPATSTAAGDYYWVVSAGTSQSITWAIGDRAIYNGVSGSWTRQVGVYPAQQTGVGTAGIFCNGWSPMYIPDSPVYGFRTDNIGITLRVTLADYTAASNQVLFDKVASNLGIRITLLTTGILRVQFGNGADLTTYQYDSTVGVQTIVSDGQPMWLDVDIVRNGNITFTVNGITLGTAVSVVASAAQTLTSTAAINILSNGSNNTIGVFHALYIRNISFATSQILSLYLSGPSVFGQYSLGGSQANLIDSSLTSATNWTLGTGWSITGGKLIGSHTAADTFPAATYIDNRVYAGAQFRARFTVDSKSGAANYSFYALANASIPGLGSITAQNYDVVVTIPSGAFGGFKFLKDVPTSTAGDIQIDNVQILPIGFLGIYEASNVLANTVLLDKTSNGGHGFIPTAIGMRQAPSSLTYDALLATWPSAVNLLTTDTTVTTTGTATVPVRGTNYWSIGTGTTAGSTARVRTTSASAVSNRYVESGSMLDYAGIIAAGFTYSSVPQVGDNGDIRIAFRASAETIGPLTNIGIGFRMNGYAVYGIYHNGTGAEKSVLLSANIGGTRRNMLSFISFKGIIQFFHQGICKATVYDGPSQSSDSGHLLCFEGSNGTVASNRSLFLFSANGFSIFP